MGLANFFNRVFSTLKGGKRGPWWTEGRKKNTQPGESHPPAGSEAAPAGAKWERLFFFSLRVYSNRQNVRPQLSPGGEGRPLSIGGHFSKWTVKSMGGPKNRVPEKKLKIKRIGCFPFSSNPSSFEGLVPPGFRPGGSLRRPSTKKPVHCLRGFFMFSGGGGGGPGNPSGLAGGAPAPKKDFPRYPGEKALFGINRGGGGAGGGRGGA